MNPTSLTVLSASALLALLCSPATAQRMVGGAFSAAAGPILQAQPYCGPAVGLCRPVLGPPPTPWAGGTAYDPIHEVIWDTDGLNLVGIRANTTACVVFCPPAPAPVPAGAVATGLAFDETRRALWMLDSLPTLAMLQFPAAGAPCPGVVNRCSLANVVPATHRTGGLAISERNDLVFYSASMFGAAVPNNLVFVARCVAPCAPLCVLPVPNCAAGPLGAITGLAYDDGLDTLILTDGNTEMRLRLNPPCGILGVDCCNAPVIAPYYGLDIEPAHSVTVGSTCVAGTCAACPNVSLGSLGDPSLGNPDFTLRVANGAPGSLAFFFMGVGACTPGVPVLCGLFHPSLAPVFLGNAPLVGAGPCGGVADFNLPIPMAPALYGGEVCVQSVLVCPPGSVSLTNALGLKFLDT